MVGAVSRREGAVRSAPPLAPTWALWIIAAAAVALMALGSVADYAISANLLNEGSVFGRLGAAAGWFPALIALSCAGTLLILAARDTQITATWRHTQRGVGALLVVASFATYPVVAPSYWNEGGVSTPAVTLVWAVVGLALTCGSVGLAVWFGKGATPGSLRKVAVFLLLVVALQTIIIFVVKLIWLRPRMRLVVQDVGVEFKPWWAIGYPNVQRFLDLGIPKDDFKSFPSAHTGNAAVAMALSTLGTLRERLVRTIPWIFALGLLWTVGVAASRIVVGAHFLTDTTVGFVVTFVCILVLYWLHFGARAFDRQIVNDATSIKQ